MSFIWAPMLVTLLVVPLLIAGYIRFANGGSTRRDELAALSLISTDDERVPSRRRHLPFALFIAAVTVLMVGFARPELTIGFPRVEGTVIVAVDSSTSMIADDVLPSRLGVAKQAAIDFVEQRPSDMVIGLVSFTNGAVVTQAPTKDEAQLISAIERMQPEGPTSIGQGVFTALGAVTGDPIPVDPAEGSTDLGALDIGYHSSAVVLVFSDGENTTDFDPIEVAKLAANAGIKIFTVGVGTDGGAAVEIDGFTIGTYLDGDSLRQMADITDGRYFDGADSADFTSVYDAIDTELRIDAEKTEVTSLVALLAMVLLLIGAGLSMRWFGRVA